ncbi:hypothetical protein BKA69DRAFT_1037181 [Paraphysoderma sedebokerense]|nr:hypothetical protein BKA69DRAFT_1037181 [Paraphysoderma sedebokerense]
MADRRTATITVADSASHAVKAYGTPPNLLCEIYAPTEIFHKAWTKIYIPPDVTIVKQYNTDEDDIRRSIDNPQPIYLKQSHNAPLQFEEANIRVYVKTLALLGKIPTLDKDPHPLLLCELEYNVFSAMQMVIPPEKFNYLRAECESAGEEDDLKKLHMNWLGSMSEKEENGKLLVYNSDEPLEQIDNEYVQHDVL